MADLPHTPVADQPKACDLFGGIDAVRERVRTCIREGMEDSMRTVDQLCGRVEMTPDELKACLKPRAKTLTGRIALPLMSALRLRIDRVMPMMITREQQACWRDVWEAGRPKDEDGEHLAPVSAEGPEDIDDDAVLSLFIRLRAINELG